MVELLRDLEVLALDCQAGGATPEHGDLLELGWARCTAAGLLAPARSHWISPRSKRPISRAVRELTGWAESCLSEAIEETSAWSALRAEAAKHRQDGTAPTVIHFARFELSFLRDLHQRLETAGAFPFDVICLHAVAARLLPELPRRNIRALAGYFGHSPELLRRSAGHVEATASIWRALVPLLDERGVASWSELKTWLERTSLGPRSGKRTFPLPAERRRALPDLAGVYRFVRSNGDVLYVGKATSLKKRVASHFKSRGPTTERALELLTQVHDVLHSETASLLEAALLESDEIKRLEPPYNVQLRSLNRSAWFASRDLREAVPLCDAAHPVGPLPSERALSGLAALSALAEGAPPTPALCAQVLAVPAAFLPDSALFQAGFSGFCQERLQVEGVNGLRRVLRAALALWLERRRGEPEAEAEVDSAPDSWDLARVRRRLDRNLVQSGLLFRRSRCLCLLADATVGFREPGATGARALVFCGGQVVERHQLVDLSGIAALPVPTLRPRAARGLSFDAATYDRLRVLLTELHRVREGGGELSLRVGKHTLAGTALAGLLRAV
jgi:DNA polymerase III subunit epsilon